MSVTVTVGIEPQRHRERRATGGGGLTPLPFRADPVHQPTVSPADPQNPPSALNHALRGLCASVVNSSRGITDYNSLPSNRFTMRLNTGNRRHLIKYTCPTFVPRALATLEADWRLITSR